MTQLLCALCWHAVWRGWRELDGKHGLAAHRLLLLGAGAVSALRLALPSKSPSLP